MARHSIAIDRVGGRGNCSVTINETEIVARRGELLLDAALRCGVDLPYNCRAGHCGTCCVKLVSGQVQGGAGAQPGIVHACQCRVTGDAIVASLETSHVRSVEGVLSSLLPLSRDVMEVGIAPLSAMPHHAGQYAQVQFDGFSARPFSITHPIRGDGSSNTVWFHMRRMPDGRVTKALGSNIKSGHRVTLTGPYGSAYFRPNHEGRLILVATNTGFAPIWSIAAAALRENPNRMMMIIAGGRSIDQLYMAPALARLANFPNVRIVPICSTPQKVTNAVLLGRPTDYLPQLLRSDVVYACGAPGMVDAIKAVASRSGAVCHADPFIQTPDNDVASSKPGRKRDWWSAAAGRRALALAHHSGQAKNAAPMRFQLATDARLRG